MYDKKLYRNKNIRCDISQLFLPYNNKIFIMHLVEKTRQNNIKKKLLHKLYLIEDHKLCLL